MPGTKFRLETTELDSSSVIVTLSPLLARWLQSFRVCCSMLFLFWNPLAEFRGWYFYGNYELDRERFCLHYPCTHQARHQRNLTFFKIKCWPTASRGRWDRTFAARRFFSSFFSAFFSGVFPKICTACPTWVPSVFSAPSLPECNTQCIFGGT